MNGNCCWIVKRWKCQNGRNHLFNISSHCRSQRDRQQRKRKKCVARGSHSTKRGVLYSAGPRGAQIHTTDRDSKSCLCVTKAQKEKKQNGLLHSRFTRSENPDVGWFEFWTRNKTKQKSERRKDRNLDRTRKRKMVGKLSTTMGDDTFYYAETLESCFVFAALHKMLFIFPSSQDLNLNRSRLDHAACDKNGPCKTFHFDAKRFSENPERKDSATQSLSLVFFVRSSREFGS